MELSQKQNCPNQPHKVCFSLLANEEIVPSLPPLTSKGTMLFLPFSKNYWDAHVEPPFTLTASVWRLYLKLISKQMQLSLQACCCCVLLYCCLTNYPNGSGLKQHVLCFCGSRHSLLGYPGHLALDLIWSLTHISEAPPGMEPLCSFLSTALWQDSSSFAFLIGHLTSFKSCGGTSWDDEDAQSSHRGYWGHMDGHICPK